MMITSIIVRMSIPSRAPPTTLANKESFDGLASVGIIIVVLGVAWVVVMAVVVMAVVMAGLENKSGTTKNNQISEISYVDHSPYIFQPRLAGF